MPPFVVASRFVWSAYPGLRAGRIYAGKPDVFRRPAGESHLVGTPDATDTLCGVPRAAFPHEFGDPGSITSDKSTPCPTCRGAEAAGPPA